MSHPDLAAEQAHVDHAYQRLEAMRAKASEMLRAAFGERGGTFQAYTERDIRVRTSLHRLEQLQLGRESLVFGRIDRVAADTEPMAESFHIGRLAVADDDQEPLVVDWRAPVAEPFYRATGAQPMGLTRRRHFLTAGRRILDLEDELFSEPGGLGDDAGAGTTSRWMSAGGLGSGLSGTSALLSALQRSRTGRMRDIVATVQREQDEIIRSPLGGILVVQGGPGTGKTAVALHRAAYLLYTYRFPLETQGVLVVGPNPVFLRYIEHVLPSLGETGVEMSTVGGLFGQGVASGSETWEAARLKGDPRMARFLARAVANRERPLRRPVQIPFGSVVLTLSPEATVDIVNAAKRRSTPHNTRRSLVESLLWRHLLTRYVEARARSLGGALGTDLDDWALVADGPTAGDGSPDGPAVAEAAGRILASMGTSEVDITPADVGAQLRRLPVVAQALDRIWPLLTPQELLRDLFGAPPLIELAGRGLLSTAERQHLVRDRSASLESVAWTEADLPLLDESRALLGSARGRNGKTRQQEPNGSDEHSLRGYGHIVVDEAQDLSPMQLRMLGRRTLSASITIVGDIAQATGEWAPTSWHEVLSHLPARRGSRVVELTVNYRTPSEIMDLASQVLEAAAPGVLAPESVRTTGSMPRVMPTDAAALPGLVTDVTIEERASLTAEATSDGTVGVICPPSLIGPVGDAMRAAQVSYGSVESGALDDMITLVPVQAAKGLEFDSVLVVEPARIVAESPQGLRALYVAMTRATRRLAIAHSEPLPVPFITEAPRPAPAPRIHRP